LLDPSPVPHVSKSLAIYCSTTP